MSLYGASRAYHKQTGVKLKLVNSGSFLTSKYPMGLPYNSSTNKCGTSTKIFTTAKICYIQNTTTVGKNKFVKN